MDQRESDAKGKAMKVFLDFEASSLSDHSWPVEVAWVFQDGRSDSHLIAPLPQWTDWDAESERIHGLSRARLEQEGQAAAEVATRMVEALGGHDLFASAPSWDGKWLSALLRGAGLDRHALRLRNTGEALEETAREELKHRFSGPQLEDETHRIVTKAGARPEDPPAHRALPDALAERDRWLAVRAAARKRVAEEE